MSYTSKYGTLCRGKTDIGTEIRQQLKFEGHSSDSYQLMFLTTMNHHKISKEHQIMVETLHLICERNLARYEEDAASLREQDVLHMKSYIHHVQNPRYGLTTQKRESTYNRTKRCLLELGVDSGFFHEQ